MSAASARNLSALASGLSARFASMPATKFARLLFPCAASASSTAQNSASSATDVRWPESVKERFFSTALFRMDHVFGPHEASNSSAVT